MRILKVESGKKPEAVEISDTLKAMQEVVGGPIQAVYPFEEPVALIANEEGMLVGLPLNRAIREQETGQVYDIIAGTFFLCGAPPDKENFASLTEAQIQRFSREFAVPEVFLNLNGQLLVLPLEDCHKGIP